jgi:hypothetical protein
MATGNDKDTVKLLVKFLHGGQAFAKMEDCLKDIPADKRGDKSGNIPHSLWELVEHLRIAQWDILDFSRNPEYKEINWPKDYWPKDPAPKDGAEWDNSVKQLYSDQKEFIALLEAPGADLHKPFPWGKGQNLLRQAMLIANHNSHHLGQIIIVRKLLGIWK